MRGVFATKYRRIGLEDHQGSSLTLAWLATHRDRLRSFILGGKRLSILLIWDSKGATPVEHDQDEVDALARIVYGPLPKDSDKT